MFITFTEVLSSVRHTFITFKRRRRILRLRHHLSISPPDPNGRSSRVPVYESDVLSNSLKSFGLPLPRLAFMHWPTKKPMTFWLPSRYCCA